MRIPNLRNSYHFLVFVNMEQYPYFHCLLSVKTFLLNKLRKESSFLTKEKIELKNYGSLLFVCFAVMLVGCNKTNRQNKHLKNISIYGMIENLQICMIIYRSYKNQFLKKNSQKNIKKSMRDWS